MLEQIHLKDLMTKDVMTILPDYSLSDFTQIMRKYRFSCLVVVEGKRPVGIISERDIVRVVSTMCGDPAMERLRAADVMTSPVVTIHESKLLDDAADMMKARRIRRVAVVDDNGELTGVVTQSDLLREQVTLLEYQRKLREANARLEALSLEDKLLGIGNRRAMESDLEFQHQIASRYQKDYSIALIDVDYFKAFNDRYGHMEGDRALKGVAVALGGAIRASDRIYRYGGEEILVLLTETPLDGAYAFGGRAIDHVRRLGIRHEGSPLDIVTVSVGVANARMGGIPRSGWKEVVKAADKALYEAKSGGRNQVQGMIPGEEGPPVTPGKRRTDPVEEAPALPPSPTDGP